MNRKTVECIFGDPDLTSEEVEILQKYFHVHWQFAKSDYIYYIDPELSITTCKQASILYSKTNKYQFKIINLNTVQEYVNRLQKPKDDFPRGSQHTTSGIQCTTSKATIASGHLEYGTIDFRWGGKAKIGKANLSF